MKMISLFTYLAASCLISSLAPPVREDEDGTEILSRTRAAYLNAKTFQAVYHTDVSMLESGEASFRVEVKTVPGSKFYLRATPNGPGKGRAGRKVAALQNMKIVDDGENAYIYTYGLNKYFHGSHDEGGVAILTLGFGIFLGAEIPPEIARLHVSGVNKVNGRPAYVLESDVSGSDGSRLALLIDQKNYMFLGCRFSFYKDGLYRKTTTLVHSSSINAPLPDSVFQFTPPAGAKQIALNGH